MFIISPRLSLPSLIPHSLLTSRNVNGMWHTHPYTNSRDEGFKGVTGYIECSRLNRLIRGQVFQTIFLLNERGTRAVNPAVNESYYNGTRVTIYNAVATSVHLRAPETQLWPIELFHAGM